MVTADTLHSTYCTMHYVRGPVHTDHGGARCSIFTGWVRGCPGPLCALNASYVVCGNRERAHTELRDGEHAEERTFSSLAHRYTHQHTRCVIQKKVCII